MKIALSLFPILFLACQLASGGSNSHESKGKSGEHCSRSSATCEATTRKETVLSLVDCAKSSDEETTSASRSTSPASSSSAASTTGAQSSSSSRSSSIASSVPTTSSDVATSVSSSTPVSTSTSPDATSSPASSSSLSSPTSSISSPATVTTPASTASAASTTSPTSSSSTSTASASSTTAPTFSSSTVHSSTSSSASSLTSSTSVTASTGRVTSSAVTSTPRTISTQRTTTTCSECSECAIIEAFLNLTIFLNSNERASFLAFIRECQNTVIADFTLSKSEKFVLIAFKLKQFFKLHAQIKAKLAYRMVADWGLVTDLSDVSIDILSDNAGSIIVLDDRNNCELFIALRKAVKGDTQKQTAVEKLVADLRAILRNAKLTYEAKLTLVFNKCQAFFAEKPSWKQFFLSIKIAGFATLEQFLEVCQVYQRTSSVNVVIGGATPKCVLIKALETAAKDTKLSASVRSQIFQIRTKFSKFFQSESRVHIRLAYISAQFFQFFKQSPFLIRDVESIVLGVWGTIRDLRFCASFSSSRGTGTASSTKPSTKPTSAKSSTRVPSSASAHATATTSTSTKKPSTTSKKPSTTTKKPSTTAKKPSTTTKKPSTTTIGPTSCSRRGQLITINKSCNCTLFTNSINAAVAKFPTVEKANFAPYKKRIEHVVFANQFKTVQAKLRQIVVILKGCAPSGSRTHRLVLSIKIGNFGSVQRFLECENAGSG